VNSVPRDPVIIYQGTYGTETCGIIGAGDTPTPVTIYLDTPASFLASSSGIPEPVPDLPGGYIWSMSRFLGLVIEQSPLALAIAATPPSGKKSNVWQLIAGNLPRLIHRGIAEAFRAKIVENISCVGDTSRWLKNGSPAPSLKDKYLEGIIYTPSSGPSVTAYTRSRITLPNRAKMFLKRTRLPEVWVDVNAYIQEVETQKRYLEWHEGYRTYEDMTKKIIARAGYDVVMAVMAVRDMYILECSLRTEKYCTTVGPGTMSYINRILGGGIPYDEFDRRANNEFNAILEMQNPFGDLDTKVVQDILYRILAISVERYIIQKGGR